MKDPRELVAVFIGGFLGTVARAEVGEALPVHPGHWPWATFLVNIAGAFVLGGVAARLGLLGRSLWGTGLCGGLTTFSTMQLELLALLDRDDVALALGYAAASVALGLAAVALATNLVKRT